MTTETVEINYGFHLSRFKMIYGVFVALFLTGCQWDRSQDELVSVSLSVTEKDCLEVKELHTDRIIRGDDELILKCSGPKGYSLYVIDDGARSWYAIEKRGDIHSLEKDIVYGAGKGDFPNVANNEFVDWVLDNAGDVVGLIFQVSYINLDEKTGHLSPVKAWYSIKIRPNKIQFSTPYDSKSDARSLFLKEWDKE